MISPSLKKRRTTRQNTRATADRREGEGRCGEGHPRVNVLQPMVLPRSASATGRQEPLWLPAGALAVLLVLLSALYASGGEPVSGWRPVGSNKLSAESTKLANSNASRFSSSTRRRVAKPQLPRHDRLVRPVGYDDDLYAAPRAGSGAQVGFSTAGETFAAQASSPRMIVRTQAIESRLPRIRTAQKDPDGFGQQFLDDLEAPFGAEPLPPGNTRRSEGDSLPEIDSPRGSEAAPGRQLPPLDERGSAQPDPFDIPGASEDTTGGDDYQIDPPAGDGDAYDSLEGSGSRESNEDDESGEFGEQRTKSLQNCSEELAKLKANRLAAVDVQITLAGVEGKDYPFQCSIDDGLPYAPRCWEPITYMWKSSGLCHKPLYFEQKRVERYGHSLGPVLDPLVAGAHFFTRLPALPYCMGLKAPNECVYTLGHYRPGSCAPNLIEQPGFTWRAAAVTGAAWTGGAFLFP